MAALPIIVIFHLSHQSWSATWPDWILGSTFVVFGLFVVARNFTRSTLRYVELAIILAAIISITLWEAKKGGPGPKGAFAAGFLGLPQADFGVFTGSVGIISLALVVLLLFTVFDIVCARREPPTVDVDHGDNSDPDTQELLEKLRFQLPAVEIKKPPIMPGATTMDNVASLVEKSDIKGSKDAALLMRLFKYIEPKPRSYVVRLHADFCGVKNGKRNEHTIVRVTVDLRDSQKDLSKVVKTLAKCPLAEAPERIAAFTARQVFLDDPSTPAWSVGSMDGEDLTAYLLMEEQGEPTRTYKQARAVRAKKRDILAHAVRNSPNAGIVRYELASLYDIDGEYLEPLRLHLVNRVLHPGFLRGRYRFAVALSMLAGDIFDEQWRINAHCNELSRPDRATQRRDIEHYLSHCRMLCKLEKPDDFKKLLNLDRIDHRGKLTIRIGFAEIAQREFRSYRHRIWLGPLAYKALLDRSVRSILMPYIKDRKERWNMQRTAKLAELLAEARKKMLIIEKREGAGVTGDIDKILRHTQDKAKKFLSGSGIFDEAEHWGKKSTNWRVVYNAACIYALESSVKKAYNAKENQVETVVELLHHAVDDPRCELERPSERIAMDPDLRDLQKYDEFKKFVQRQAIRDFDIAPVDEMSNGGNDSWFIELLQSLWLERRRSSIPRQEGVAARRQWKDSSLRHSPGS